MNKRQAYQLGVESGYEAGIYGEFETQELIDSEMFMGACSEICDNKRQFADSPTYELAKEPNADSLFDAFDDGEAVGVRKAWRKLVPERKRAENQELLSEALRAHQSREYDFLKVVNDPCEVPAKYFGDVLHINDHGNVTLYVARRRRDKNGSRFIEIASMV